MEFALLTAAIIAYMIYSDIAEKNAMTRNTREEHTTPTEHGASNTNWFPYPYQYQGPVFSPTRRYVWDGEKWVRNETFFSAGFAIGLLIGLVLLFLYIFN